MQLYERKKNSPLVQKPNAHTTTIKAEGFKRYLNVMYINLSTAKIIVFRVYLGSGEKVANHTFVPVGGI
jgi:hypothetical protein